MKDKWGKESDSDDEPKKKVKTRKGGAKQEDEEEEKRETNAGGAEVNIDDIDERKKTELSDKKIVGIDPGKCDLLYCVSEEDGKLQKFRYSNVQRVKETKSKHYSKIIEKIKKNEHIRACAHRIGNTVERLQREKLFFRNDNGLHKNKKRSQCESVHTLSQRTLS